MRHALRSAIIVLALGLGAPALAQHHGGHGRGGHSGGGHVSGGHAGSGHGARGHGVGLHGTRHGARHYRGRFSLGLGFGTFGYGGYYGGWSPYYVQGGYPGFGFAGSGWRVLEPAIALDPLLRDWVMLRFDANGSGRLGRDEARAANAAFWSLTDRDGNGTATDAEWNAAREIAAGEVRAAYGAEPASVDESPAVPKP